MQFSTKDAEMYHTDIDGLEELMNAATPGPYLNMFGHLAVPSMTNEDIDFIVAFRTVAPDMIAELRQLRKKAEAAGKLAVELESAFRNWREEPSLDDRAYTALTSFREAIK